MFKSKAKEEFGTDIYLSVKMEKAILKWMQIYGGHPEWVDEDDGIKTINFAKSIASETARLTCLDLSIKLEGSARAVHLQNVIDGMFHSIRKYVEECCACGTVILKPNGDGVECLRPDRFLITETDEDGNVRGIIFFDYKEELERFYTRMEYHRFDGDVYWISNRVYKSKSKGTLGEKIEIGKSPWRELLPDVGIENLEKPLYAVFKTPMKNHIDTSSPLGISIFAEAIEELKDLDIAYSRNAEEIKNSGRIVLVDERLVQLPALRDEKGNVLRRNLKMPKYVKNVLSDDSNSYYQEVNPELNTEIRVKGINILLSIIAYKCGYSNGYFSFDEMQGIQTATGVEASQQRTIQLIKDIRDALRNAMDNLVYALDKYADLYDMSPVGEYETTYGFGDICYNYEEDKKTWYGYVQAGKVPFWLYLMKFENMSEEEAKEVSRAAQEENRLDDGGLFGEE